MLLVVVSPHWPLGLIALQLVAQTAAGFPLRQTLYSETWSIGAYLGFFSRLTISIFAFWIALFSVPSLVHMAAPHEWLAAGALAVVMLAWNWFSSDLLRWLLRV